MYVNLGYMKLGRLLDLELWDIKPDYNAQKHNRSMYDKHFKSGKLGLGLGYIKFYNST